MKYLFSLITLFFLVAACQEEVQVDPNAIPTDLNGKKEFLKNTKCRIILIPPLVEPAQAPINSSTKNKKVKAGVQAV